ncbi:hypothetical protein V8F06_011960 [Rhypophila decipiens]
MLNELPMQLPASDSARPARGAYSNQRPGNTMRINKPRSANNSPRAALSQSRRRTLIGENFQSLQGRQQQQIPDLTYLPTPASEVPSYEPEKRSARPVSWHPTTYNMGQPHTFHRPQAIYYPHSACTEAEAFPSLQQYSPSPAVYSGYTTPMSSFSPLSLPYSHFDSEQYFPPQTMLSQQAPASQHMIHSQQTSPAAPYQVLPQALNVCSAPPTPEYLNQYQEPETKLATEESIPFQPLEDDESEGEILYGMGLYDPPDKSYNEPSLGMHRSTLMSLLGGSPVPTGKGLKLEAAWEPPASEDEDEGSGSEQDAEGEDQDD